MKAFSINSIVLIIGMYMCNRLYLSKFYGFRNDRYKVLHIKGMNRDDIKIRGGYVLCCFKCLVT